MLWSSTAASRVDLHPDASFNFSDTEAYAGSIAGQVGYGFYTAGSSPVPWHAVYWNGTAASAVDLHKYLGGLGNFSGSQAFGIADDGTIVGVAYVGVLGVGTTHPVVWKPVTESGVAGDYNNDGRVDAADYVVWRKHSGTNYVLINEVSGTTPYSVSQEDRTAWVARFANAGSGGGATASASLPEPKSLLVLILAIASWSIGRYRPV